jgi:hypothetical protein
MCNIKNLRIVGTYLKWAIWVVIIYLCKLSKNELWNCEDYKLILRIAIIQLVGSEKKSWSELILHGP